MEEYNKALAKRDADAREDLLERLGITGNEGATATLSAEILAAALGKSFGWALPGGQLPLGRGAVWNKRVLGPKHGEAAWTVAEIDQLATLMVGRMAECVAAYGDGAGGAPPRMLLCAPPDRDSTDGHSRMDALLQRVALEVPGEASFVTPMSRAGARRAHNSLPALSVLARHTTLETDVATYTANACIGELAGATVFVFDDIATSGCTLAAYCVALQRLAPAAPTRIFCVPLCVALERETFTLEVLGGL